ncbi:MAG TPA: sugar phosphate nucleotidyltransferase [Bacteroidota bacterium]|nr:sugar phosphate nucleotidyltransferase [Bacteroidota bacterium]
MDAKLAVVVMAAGKGTRMNNPSVAKVMYTINERPLIDWVVDLATRLDSSRTVAVVGWQKEAVIAHLAGAFPSVVCVEQSPQLGTGHAVMQAERELRSFAGEVLVLSGDVPMLTYGTTRALIDGHRASGSAATVLSAILDDATGYGRIIREPGGTVSGIVEQKDASEEQRAIREINSGIYVFDAGSLFEGLRHITTDNAQHEYYLTDVVRYLWRNKRRVSAVIADDPLEVGGINTPAQLEDARRILAGGGS